MKLDLKQGFYFGMKIFGNLSLAIKETSSSSCFNNVQHILNNTAIQNHDYLVSDEEETRKYTTLSESPGGNFFRKEFKIGNAKRKKSDVIVNERAVRKHTP